jgi:Lon protease-like protein
MSSIPLQDSPPVPLQSTLRAKIATASTKESTVPSEPLDAHEDARAIIRLAQCPHCSCPLKEPVTLPCGNSICKKCLPESHLRTHVSYPATPARLQAFTCPVTTCKQEHADGDCSVDVVLNKTTEIVRNKIEAFRNSEQASRIVLQLEEKDRWSIAGVASLREKEPRTRVLSGGRLCATFAMAAMGELAYDSELIYASPSPSPPGEEVEILDKAVLENVKDATRSELDCQVCYGLFLDPITTACGHTFCRTCMHRLLDHSNLCPVCRRVFNITPASSAQAPANSLLVKLLEGLCPDAVSARREMVKSENISGIGELDTPLFVCTLSIPTAPTFLHVFEPRYRLMIRRAMEYGDRKFGMILPNRGREPQGELGRVPFFEYGTLLHIVDVDLHPDGRSFIQCIGVSRFRILAHGTLDGYMVGKVERVEDISLAAEEGLEAAETSASSTGRALSAQEHFGAPPFHTPTTPERSEATMRYLATLSTQQLMEICTSFITKMRARSASWLQRKVFTAYGEMPTDPAVFPWWFAAVLPISETEKYKLLQIQSVRERLKFCAAWITLLEQQRWYADFLCCSSDC